MPPAKANARASARIAAAALSGVLAASAVLGVSGCAGTGASPHGSPWTGGQAGNAQAAGGQPGGGGVVTAAAATSRIRNPGNGRMEAVVPDINRTVLLIGDSQSEPADGWPRLGLASAGYNVYFCGRGGTGYVAANGATGNYIDALQRGDWLLPSGAPALIVIEGGGNDAASGASNARITENAERLIAELKARYPGTRMAMLGTLARGADNGGGRRSEVDALLGSVAGAHGLPFVSVGDWLTRYGLTKDLADSVHMNTAGRAALGGILAGRLRELGLDRKTSAGQGPLAAVAGGNGGYQD
ncbi:SGNH/GDSL hydrolase family protein [Pseudarthrobacter phenanthrenivorans]|uniref:SGNH/GDSL hydrolase family protein n=1 Tax=Pseudarthrobacter phenanthrenivorans TaxID=361575 RepID=UPI00344DED95